VKRILGLGGNFEKEYWGWGEVDFGMKELER
jgi:hypothetical protein